jgi:hypothetical protein
LPFQLLFAWKLSSLLWILPFAPKTKKKLSSWMMLSSAGTIQHFVSLASCAFHHIKDWRLVKLY